jgi:hypothetical protein
VLPVARLPQDGVEHVLCLIDRAMKHSEKPGEPLGDIQRSLLGPLQDVVVGIALALDLDRKAIKSLWAAVCACQPKSRSRDTGA